MGYAVWMRDTTGATWDGLSEENYGLEAVWFESLLANDPAWQRTSHEEPVEFVEAGRSHESRSDEGSERPVGDHVRP